MFTKSGDKKEPSRLGLPPVRESSTSSSNSTVKPSQSRPAVPAKDVPRKSATAPPTGQPNDRTRLTSRGRLTKERPRRSSEDSQSKEIPQIPPELAHLNVEPPSKPALNKALPPIRPSRDGTPSLSELSKPSPIVQSDLPKLYTTYHKRTPSQETPTSPSLKSRFGLSSKASSRQPSPRVDSAISPPPASRPFIRGPTPDIPSSDGQKLSRKDSPAVGPSPSKSPRFGFFSRKPKEMTTKPLEKPKRQVTKGPAAGTGHEGYGRFGFRGRSGSTTSSTGLRSPSTDSSVSAQPVRKSTSRQSSVGSKDGAELDDFLKERLNPVYLRGSGSTVSATASSSDGQGSSVVPSSNTSSLEYYPKPQLLPSAMGETAGTSPSKPLHAAESGEAEMTSRSPAKFRRSSVTQPPQNELNFASRMTARFGRSPTSRQDSVESSEADMPADMPFNSTAPTNVPLEGREGLWLRERIDDSKDKPHRGWNFFQRSQASPKSKGKEKQTAAPRVPGYIANQAQQRGVAHYTMLGSVEQVGLDEVERIAHENFTSPDDSLSESNMPSRIVPYEDRHSSLLPSPPKLEYSRDADFKARPTLPRITIRQDSTESGEVIHAQKAVPNLSPSLVDIRRSPSTAAPEEHRAWQDMPPRHDHHTPEMPQAPFNTPEKTNANSSPRQPRLSPVGRIPQVVSRRDRDRKLSDSSFSRPFVRTQPRPSVKPPGSLYSEIRELASPVEPSSGSQPVSSTSTHSNGGSADFKSSVNTGAPSASTARTSIDMHANPEFFALPPRKDSDVSYSTSSGHNSYLAPMLAPGLHEDEIWSEYNDLMDDVLSHNTPLSTGSSLGAPFQYSNMLQEYSNAAAPDPLNWRQPPAVQLPSRPQEPVPTVLSVPQQISRFMQPSMSPLTPHTLADFYDQYGNASASALSSADRTSVPSQYRSSIPAQERSSQASQQRSSLPGARASMASSRYSRGSGHSRSASLPETNVRHSQSSLTQSGRFNRDTQLLDIAEVDGDEQAAAANLRFGALMTSKWLSNGRVLFSPAHNEMRLADAPRVLILDGLGSDWSYYVALSYPAATVYNLGPGSASWPGVSQMPPSNHRHITHAAISAAFPFPKGFFTAVVFRFPIATNDQAYQACIFECKRVLRPGGYLEVTVLDLDLNCMGNRARKAVRGLKTRMQQRDPAVSLRNTSDHLLRVIGRRGFEEVQRCIVGVPAAGRIPRSQDISSRSSRDSSKPSRRRESGEPAWGRESRTSQEFSFADLLEDARANHMETDTRKNDEGITKTVAKVGRWWYSSCYEKALLPADNSIWSDQALLRECEKQGTSFRLLICHAQKPAQTRRRTVSV